MRKLMKKILIITAILIILVIAVTILWHYLFWPWSWSNEKTNPYWYSSRSIHKSKWIDKGAVGQSLFQIEKIQPLDEQDDYNIMKISLFLHWDDKTPRFTWIGNQYSAFVICNSGRSGGILIYNDQWWEHEPCTLVAYDLVNQNELWRRQIQEIKPIYMGPLIEPNRINIIDEYDKKGYIIVYGNSAFGPFIDKVDILTGKSLYHREYSIRDPWWQRWSGGYIGTRRHVVPCKN
jgi:hypothetical protein